jgi:hypothetical protein
LACFKKRLLAEEMKPLQIVTVCGSSDGKMRLTDVADTEQLFRLIQSIPSPKAEPLNNG